MFSDYMNNFLSAASGFIAGTVSSVVCYPLQIIQVQQQVSNNKRTVIDTIRAIYQKQGLRGYYYGVTNGILGYSIFYGTYFYTYDWIKEETNWHPFVSSYLAAAVGSIISNPWHVLRVRRQTCILSGQTNLKPTIRGMYTEEGVRALYKGTGTTIVKNFELSLIMTVNEHLRNQYQIPIVYASFASKLIAASISYPLDTWRNLSRNGKIIKDSNGQPVGRTAFSNKEILTRFWHNPKCMYNGYPVYLVKSLPACVIAFSVNQYLRGH